MDGLKYLLAVAVTTTGAMLTEEFKAWLPRLADRLVLIAVRRLPATGHERYSEEWAAYLQDTPGYFSKLLVAFGLFLASRKMASEWPISEPGETTKLEHSAKKKESGQSLLPGAIVRKSRVLVVDDERVIADTLAIILNQVGFIAEPAYSGERAIAIANDFKPDSVITDVLMTGITGIEAGIQIRSILPDCEVVLFGGQAYTTDLIRKAAHDGHTFRVLPKPTHPAEIIECLRPSSRGDSPSDATTYRPSANDGNHHTTT